MYLVKIIIAALLSGIIFSLSMAMMWGNWEYLIPFLMYSTPITFIGGLIFSTVNEIIVKKIPVPYQYVMSLVVSRLFTFRQ
ncbi:hypothetical protein ACLIA0_10215 [Bacillaceae bacterium W0354]